MQIGPYVISRGTMVPYGEDDTTSQTRKVAGDGSVTVVDQAFGEESFFRAKIKIPQAEAKTIRNYLLAVGFARDTFSMIDGFGVTHTVRFWDKRVRRRNIAGGLVEMDLLFREEIVAP